MHFSSPLGQQLPGVTPAPTSLNVSSAMRDEGDPIGYHLQRSLSKAQAIPIIGIIPSVIKLTVSVVEIILGLALSILFGFAALILRISSAHRLARLSAAHIGHGLLSLGYSVFNIASLGFWAYKVEKRLGSVKL